MSTETQSRKVQQGPNLRAVIAELPAESHSDLCRTALANATPGEVASAINSRLVNDIVGIVRVIESASWGHRDGYNDKVQVGIMEVCDGLRDELHQIGRLLWAISRDEKGKDVPEMRS